MPALPPTETTLPAPLLASLKSALQNISFEWTCPCVIDHTHTEKQVSVSGGGGEPPAPVSSSTTEVVHLSRAIQLESVPKNLFLNFTVELEDGALEKIVVNYDAMSFVTTDAPLYEILSNIAGAAVEARKTALATALTS